MSGPGKKIPISFEEYLSREEVAEYKSEYYQGEIFATSGGTPAHSLIGSNVTAELRNALMGQDCLVYNSDLKLRIEAADAIVYPDGMVICGPIQLLEGRKDVVINPVLVVEILSDSTAAWDRGGKFRQYRMLPSLQEYVLIEQKEPQVDVFRRNEQNLWVLESYAGFEASVQLISLGIQIPMSGLYHGLA